MRSRAGVSLLLASCFVFVSARASATLSEALSLRDLVAQSDHVVLGSCVDERTLRDHRNRIVTDYTLRVEESMKGGSRPGELLTMRCLGGALGDLGMRVEGEPRLAPGERYLMFLYSTSTALRPVGMSQGVLSLTDERGALMVHPGGAGLALVQRDAAGQLISAPSALLRAEPWERLRERVADLIREAP